MWIPQRFIVGKTILLRAFIDEINRLVRMRGVVLSDGQVLSTEIAGADWPEDVLIEHGLYGINGLKRLKDGEVVLSVNTTEKPPTRKWSPALEPILEFHDPVHLNDEQSGFSESSLIIWVEAPYLYRDELIEGLVHGIEDGRYFYCPCHGAEVVYTTRGRLVCMGCGHLHAVLADRLSFRPLRRFTEREWFAHFDHDGNARFEKVWLSLVDFRKFEHAKMLWQTDWWESACHEFILFARTPPDELREMLRGTEQDGSILAEAGFSEEALPPPPAVQIADAGVDFSLTANAAHAINMGAAALIRARAEPKELVGAITEVFRCVELLLKSRLAGTAQAPPLETPLNIRKLLQLVQTAGARLSGKELSTISELRRLRNTIQHAAPKFSYRAALNTVHSAVEFIDRFSRDELGLWLGDAIQPNDWRIFLGSSANIRAAAVRVAHRRLKSARLSAKAEVTQCDFCQERTMLREDPRSGARCVLCGHVPVIDLDS